MSVITDKKTKIICTLGPSSSDEETLKAMMLAGMNVARLNFSHGTHEEHKVKMDLVKKVRDELKLPIAIMLDTKGPEFRIRTFAEHSVELKAGDTFVFYGEDKEGSAEGVSVSYPNLAEELQPGDTILVNDGLVNFAVKEIKDRDIVCEVVIGGKLSDRKSMSFPNKVLKQKFLSEQDKSDILFGLENDIDFISASFVSCAQDVKDIRELINAHGGSDVKIIAKLENRSGVDNADEILDNCEGVMVARGDLGVEVPYVELPAIQKKLIKLCRQKGGLSVVATEMLESMINNPRPTRAEISDVANAVYDGTSVIMLSGETAAGKYPVEAVTAMANIALETEKNINYTERFIKNSGFELENNADALSHSACMLAIDTQAKCIVACTKSGNTAYMISRFRGPTPIIGMTMTERSYRQLSMSWNVRPVMASELSSTDVLFYKAMIEAKKSGLASEGDTVVITGGIASRSGSSLIKIDTVPAQF